MDVATKIFTEQRLLQARSIVLGDGSFVPTEISGVSGISIPYEIKVFGVVKNNVDNDPQTLLGSTLSCTINYQNSAPQYLHGLVTSIQKLKQANSLILTISPWLSLLKHSQDCRIFQNKSIPEIVQEIFTEKGFQDFDFGSLKSTYPKLPYIVQFNETDYDFINRLLAEAGIYYFFKHEINKHTLVAIDSVNQTPLIENVIYNKHQNESSAHIYKWHEEVKLSPQALVQSDYNPNQPNTNLQTSANHAVPSNQNILKNLQHYQYPGGYNDKSLGQENTQIKMDSLQSNCNIVNAESDYDNFYAGNRIKLSSDGSTYLITSLNIKCKDETVIADKHDAEKYYKNYFTAQSTSIPFRPAQISKPMITGIQTATVVGPKDQDIYMDEQGRIKVQFHWDRHGQNNQDSSCWIRPSQGQAGANWGNFFIPRVGQEVLIAFLNGDPDRPMIIGSAYNSVNTPAYSLPDEKYLSGIKSQSTDGKPGGNELTFNDQGGSESVLLKAQRDYDQVVEKDSRHITKGNTRTTIKDGDYTIEVQTGSSSTTAKKQVKFNVQKSTLHLDPSGITISAPKIELNPGSSGGSSGLDSNWHADTLIPLGLVKKAKPSGLSTKAKSEIEELETQIEENEVIEAGAASLDECGVGEVVQAADAAKIAEDAEEIKNIEEGVKDTEEAAADISKENEIYSKKIANGHAWDKHVIKQKEFPDISTKEEFQRHIKKVMENPTEKIIKRNGERKEYWHAESKTYVLKDPKVRDDGTAFKPKRGYQYFEDQKD